MLFYQHFQALQQVPETVDTDHAMIRLNTAINARVAREFIEVFGLGSG